jgi:UDPglucose 6-dehydrogenase
MSAVIAVIGSGYVGLTTGVCLASLGHRVTCADIDERRIALLEQGQTPFVERGLGELLACGREEGNLQFTSDVRSAVRGCEFIYLCLPTPRSSDGSADLSYLGDAVANIADLLEPNSIVINKSTVPVGSVNFVEQIIGRDDIRVVSNPEFLREGSAVHDFFHPDRIVVGSNHRDAAIKVADLYKAISSVVMVTDPSSAEMIKYASNAFLAMKLSYVNEIANLCESLGADADDVLLGMGYDKRIGREFLEPGPGWGGSCFPKDSLALLEMARDVGCRFDMVESMIESNAHQFDLIVESVQKLLKAGLEGSRIAIWGLTFKAETDDRRNSPAVAVARRLLDRGANVVAFDPTVVGQIPEEPRIEIASDEIAACRSSDALVVLTEWDQFKWISPESVASAMKSRAVVDARNLLDPNAFRRSGFTYVGRGR